MKTILKTLLLVGVLFLPAALDAQIPTQNFSWTVTGTGTETWWTDDLYYHAVTVSGNSSTSWTPGVSGTASYQDQVSPGYLSSAACSVGGVFLHQAYYVMEQWGWVEVGDPGPHSGSFTVFAGQAYNLESSVGDNMSGASLTVWFPYGYQWNSHTAMRSGTATGNNSVSVSEGQKNLWGFAPSAVPQPQAGGTMSGITYSITCNNPNVVLVFSDTMAATTTDPNAYIFASVAPVPSQVTGMSMASNTVTKNGTATMVWNWTATPYTAGYQVVFAQYINGAWQTPTTNYTSTNTYTFTGILPGAPCEIFVSATNVSGIGPASAPVWPYAATVPVPAQVTGLLVDSNIAVSTNSTTMVWNWTAANYAAGYQVVLDQYINGVWQTPTTNYTSTNFYTFTGITPGTPCEITIAGTNVNEISLTNVFSVGPASTPAWPTAAYVPQIWGYILGATNYAVAAGNSVIKFTWSAATNAAGYEAILAHYLNGVWQPPTTNGITATSITYSNLMPGDPYEFYVVPTNVLGVGIASSIDWPIAAPHVPGAVPGYIWTTTNFLASPGSTTLNFVWNAAPGVSGFMSSYEAILAHYVGGVWQAPVTNFTSLTNITYYNLTPGDPYEFYVVATNNAGAGPASATNWPYASVYPALYNTISSQLLSGGNMRMSFVGNSGAKYALDRSFSLMPANWVPLVTNTADSNGGVIFTNSPASATNNFWRIRSVP
jgi:hypothetical protein